MNNNESSHSFRQEKITASQARALLEEGNRRFVEGKMVAKDISMTRRQELSQKGQKPFAAILGCPDSRVPPEILFDQGLGDLFVIRTAGNIVDAINLGSLEYAAANLDVPLLVVLGHENCGAVKVALQEAKAPDRTARLGANLTAIVDKIQPSLEKAIERIRAGEDKSSLLECAVDENIKTVAEELVLRSPAIAGKVNRGEAEVLGAKYYFHSGAVVFFAGQDR